MNKDFIARYLAGNQQSQINGINDDIEKINNQIDGVSFGLGQKRIMIILPIKIIIQFILLMIMINHIFTLAIVQYLNYIMVVCIIN